jgi:tetratricopeptide (TPR) repeat protein
MPILNQRLLLRVVFAAIVLVAGLVVLQRVQAVRVPDALLWQADAAAEKGKTEKAVFYLRQYLEFRPDDHVTILRLADMMRDRPGRRDLKNAQFLYERVYREAPERADVGRKLVAVCMEMRRYEDALTHAEHLCQKSPDQVDGVLLGQIAECQVAQNRHEAARQSFEAAIAKGPDNIRAYERYADLLERHFQKPKDAGVVLDRLVRGNPGQADAFLARARHLKRYDRPDDAMRDLDRVFALDPENGEALVLSAEIHQVRGDIRKAKEALGEAIELYPRYAQGYRALSWLELLSGNEADARAILERGVAVLPNAPELLSPLVDLWINQGEMDRVPAIAARLEALHAAAPADERKALSLRLAYLRGRVLMAQRKWSEAVPMLETLRTDATGQPALVTQVNLLLSACRERQADRAGQVEALKRALDSDPNHLAARVALANAHLNAGRVEDALKEYQVAARSPYAGVGVQTTYASLRLAWARLAEPSADEWMAIGSFIRKVRAAHKEALDPVVVEAEWLAARGDFAAAEKVLRDAVRARAGDTRLWSALAGMVSRGRGTLAAADVLAEAQLAAGDAVELRLARARIWADDLQPGRTGRLARLEDLPLTAGDAERVALCGGLAELYAAIRDDSGQMRMLTQLAGHNPQDLSVRKTIYALALRGDDTALQLRWRDELKRVEGPAGQSFEILDALAAVGKGPTGDRRLGEWHDLAKAVLAGAPDHGDANRLMAAVAEKRGDLNLAAKHHEIAADLDPTILVAQESRLGFYLRTGQDEAARRTIARLEADPRLSSQRFRAVVEAAILQGGTESLGKCVGWLTGHLKREPRSVVWAGRLLESRGKVTDAVALYRQVTEAHPAFGDGWSARLLVAARFGEADVSEVMTAAAKALDRKGLFAMCAECGAAVRAKVHSWSPPVNTAEDRRTYAEACIAACEARGRLDDAVPVLRALAADKDAGDDATWAKRALAALTAALGTADQRRDAIGALRSGTDRPASIADARSRVATMAVALRTVSGEDRRLLLREMIALASGIVRDPTATSNDWYQLAQLYRAAGDRAEARNCLEELTRREPGNLFYMAAAVNDLLSENRLSAAEPLVGRLKDGAADLRVAAAAARYHALANQPAEALTILDRYVRAADAGTVDGAGRQRQAAELLDQLTRLALASGLSGSKVLLDGARERYRASLRAFPEAAIPMVGLLAFHGEVQPAFDELDRHKAKLSPTALATAGVAILRSGHADPRQFQTVKAWIEAALVESPGSIPLKLNLGELHALRQDFATAEQVYRDVLHADSKNAVALNNLAWILAPRADAADQALKLAERAIELYGATGEMLDTRARILISAGRYDRAVADLSDAINQNGTALRYFHLALAQLRMAKPDDAAKTFREARARGLDPKSIHPHDLPTYKALADRAVQ